MRRCISAFAGLMALSAAFLPTVALAENKVAEAAYAAGDKRQAFELWKVDAENGDTKAQLLIANMLATGDGVTKSFDIANIYYQLAADNGDLEAMVQLAANYRLGQGVEIDLMKAEDLLKQAAASGHPVAQFDLGEMYLEDLQNEDSSGSLAAAWYEAAAKQGVVLAQLKLAKLCFKGLTRKGVVQVPKDPAWAFTWLEIAKRNAEGTLPEAAVSKRIFGLDETLPSENTTLRQYVLDEYARVSAELPADVVAQIKSAIDGQLASVSEESDVKTD